MKYTKIILLLLLLLTAGCNTTEEVQQSTITIEEAEEALALLYHDTIALSISSFYISEEDVAPLFPASLADYSDTLYRYSRLQKDASTSLKDLLNAAAMHALDALDGFSYVAAHPKESLIDSDLFSSNESTIISYIRPIIASYIGEKNTLFENVYRELLFECDVLKKNYENLHKVGHEQSLGEIGPFDYGKASEYVAQMVYQELYQNEIKLRNTPLSQQSNPLYAYFWEEL